MFLLKRLAFAFICILTVCLSASCLIGSEDKGISPSASEIQTINILYKQATLITIGKCTGSVAQLNGSVSCSVSVSEVIAGSFDLEKPLECTGSSVLEVNSEYLLFLYKTDSVYKIISSGAFKLGNDSVLIDNRWIKLSEIKTPLKALSSVIAIPYVQYFYSNLSDLTQSSEFIFLGEILSAPKPEPRMVKSVTATTSIEHEVPVAVIKIRVLGSVHGRLKYNSSIKMVDIPDSVSSMTDAVTLKAVSYSSNVVLPLEEKSIYMFFLNKGTDPKQNYFFPANPVQGWVKIERDFVTVARFNSPVYGYKTLQNLVSDINNTLPAQ